MAILDAQALERAFTGDAPGAWLSVRGGVRAMLEGALRGGGPAGMPRLPWVGWLVVSLCRYRARQRWAIDVLGAREITRADDYQPIEGMPGWLLLASTYRTELCSTVTGERIAVGRDLSDPTPRDPDRVCPRELAMWVESFVTSGNVCRALDARDFPETFVPAAVTARHLPEARLWRWIPSTELVAVLVELLDELGIVQRVGAHDVAIVGPLDALADQIAAEDFGEPEVSTRWARHLGDPEVDGAHGTWSVEDAREAHRAWVHRLVGVRMEQASALLPLLPLYVGGVELVWACDALLDATHPEDTKKVIAFLLDRPALPASHAVERLLRELPTRSRCADLAALAIEYVLVRGLDRELAERRFDEFAALAEQERHSYDVRTYAVLALDRLPERALRLVRCALRWSYEGVVNEIAAALVALDQPWCGRELAAAYRDRPRHTRILREALGLCRHRPDDVPPFVGKSALAQHAAWIRTRHPRAFPPDFGS